VWYVSLHMYDNYVILRGLIVSEKTRKCCVIESERPSAHSMNGDSAVESSQLSADIGIG